MVVLANHTKRSSYKKTFNQIIRAFSHLFETCVFGKVEFKKYLPVSEITQISNLKNVMVESFDGKLFIHHRKFPQNIKNIN